MPTGEQRPWGADVWGQRVLGAGWEWPCSMQVVYNAYR